MFCYIQIIVKIYHFGTAVVCSIIKVLVVGYFVQNPKVAVSMLINELYIFEAVLPTSCVINFKRTFGCSLHRYNCLCFGRANYYVKYLLEYLFYKNINLIHMGRLCI